MNCIHESLEHHKAKQRAAFISISKCIHFTFLLDAYFSESLMDESDYVLFEANSLKKKGHFPGVSGFFFLLH